MSSETADKPIAIKDLHKAFDGQKVLDGVTLQVVRGETVAVLGRSGGGKSVLLKLLIRLETPDSGSIRIAGQEITRLDEKQLNDVRKKIGFLFQQAALYDSLTVEENVAFPLLIFAAGVFWIGNKQFLFHSTYRLNAEFPSE